MFWMPNGAYRRGMPGSVNAPARFTRLNCPSKTSTRRLWKSVAYRKSPLSVEAMARPLYSASTLRRLTTVDERVHGGRGRTPGLQPRMRPLDVANMDGDAPMLVPSLTL